MKLQRRLTRNQSPQVKDSPSVPPPGTRETDTTATSHKGDIAPVSENENTERSIEDT